MASLTDEGRSAIDRADRARRLDPRARMFLGWLRLIGWPPLDQRTVEQARRDYRTLAAATSGWRPMASVAHARVPAPGREIPVRVYRPLRRGGRPAPLLVWFHGGGFTVGDLFTADGMCRRLAHRSAAIVVSVDYRRAPEHPLPAAHEDAVVATRWAIEHCPELGADASRVVIGGDSAGGCLAAHASRMLRDEGGRQAALQLLFYPATDLSMAHAEHDPEVAQLLTPEALAWFARQSMPGLSPAERRAPAISPMFADDLSGLPPALVMTAAVDPVRPDGIAYVERLRAAGIPSTHLDHPGQIHGFAGMDLFFPAGARALDTAARAIADVRPVAVAPAVVETGPIHWYPPEDEKRTRLTELALRTPPGILTPLTTSVLQHRTRNAAHVLRRAGSLRPKSNSTH